MQHWDNVLAPEIKTIGSLAAGLSLFKEFLKTCFLFFLPAVVGMFVLFMELPTTWKCLHLLLFSLHPRTAPWSTASAPSVEGFQLNTKLTRIMIIKKFPRRSAAGILVKVTAVWHFTLPRWCKHIFGLASYKLCSTEKVPLRFKTRRQWSCCSTLKVCVALNSSWTLTVCLKPPAPSPEPVWWLQRLVFSWMCVVLLFVSEWFSALRRPDLFQHNSDFISQTSSHRPRLSRGARRPSRLKGNRVIIVSFNRVIPPMTACVLTQEQLRPLIPLASLLLTANPSFLSRSGESLPDNKAEAGTSAGR